MYPDKASGELKPGKKGIALSEEQVSTAADLPFDDALNGRSSSWVL